MKKSDIPIDIFLNEVFMPSLLDIDIERHRDSKVMKYYKKYICRLCRGILKRRGKNLTKQEQTHLKNKYQEFIDS